MTAQLVSHPIIDINRHDPRSSIDWHHHPLILALVTLTSIGGAANAIGTLTSSAAEIVIDGGTDTDTAQALTISNVSSGVDSINATNFDQSLIVSGVNRHIDHRGWRISR